MITPVKSIEISSPLNFKGAFKNTLKYMFQYHLPYSQVKFLEKIPREQIDTFEHSMREINNSKVIQTKITDLQNRDGYAIEARTKCRYDREHRQAISFNIRVDDSCKPQTTRVQENINIASSRLKDSDTETKIFFDYGIMPYAVRIIKIEPDCITDAELSPCLPGAYEVSHYKFKDYPENFNLVNAVEQKQVEGKHLSKVIKNADYIIFSEKTENNDISSKRCYVEKEDGSYRKYQYKISQRNQTLLDVQRSWRRISENETITKVNGKTYVAKFEGKIATIEDDEGNCRKLDFRKIAPEFSMEFLKTIDADVMLKIAEYVKKIYLAQNACIKYYDPLRETITSDENYFTLLHELGHTLDYNLHRIPERKEKEKKLVEIYNEELDEFNKVASSKVKEITSYFSNQSVGCGIDEIVAETNALLHICSDSELEVSARGFFLVRYFPKTIAYCAELLK